MTRPTDTLAAQAVGLERSLIVSDTATAISLTRAGIAATSYDALLNAPEPAPIAYFDDQPAVLVVGRDRRGRAAVVRARLGRLGIPVRQVYRAAARRLP